MGEERTVRRPVDVEDPKLSPDANRMLTEEVREAIGTDEVEVPEREAEDLGRKDLAAEGATLSSTLMRSRILTGMGVATGVVVAAVLVLATGDWPWIFLAVAVLIAAVLTVSLGAIETMTNVEQPSPSRV